MTLVRQSDTILQNNSGRAYAGVRVQAFVADVEQQLYSDADGTEISLVETDANGAYQFWIEEGDYDLLFSLGGQPLGSGDYSLWNLTRAADLASADSGKGSALVGFLQSGSGAVARLLSSKLTEYVTPLDFGAQGKPSYSDTLTDETDALTAFYQHAIDNPGIPHIMPLRVYGISAPLPTIDVPNVWIEGARASQHSVGPTLVGTIIKWIGTPMSDPMLTITSVPGASNTAVKNVRHRGIWFDCDGKAGIGVRVTSIFDSQIDLLSREATVSGADLDIVPAALGGSAATNRCQFNVKGRQISNAVPCLRLSGSSIGNVSMNDIWFDCNHKDAPAMVATNGDNNDWRYFRATFVTGGAATYSAELHGSDLSTNEAVRCERFHLITAKKPFLIKGTASYVHPVIKCRGKLDTDNGTPAPVIEAGAQFEYQRDSSMRGDNDPVVYTPVVTASSGAITSYTASAEYKIEGRFIFVDWSITITDNGTAAGGLIVTLPPVTPVGSVSRAVNGQNTTLSKPIVGRVVAGGTTTTMRLDGGHPVTANGQVLNFGCRYLIQ